VPSPFELDFFQRGVVEVLLLALASGLVGTWVVLRGLSFFAHAVGTATFPGLVLADGLGFSAAIGAFGCALIVALLVGGLVRSRDAATDSVTALVLAASLAAGTILASDVFQSQAGVDRLLFGSLLAIDGADQALAALAAAAALAGTWLLGPRWLAAGFAGDDGRQPSRLTDGALVLLVALCAVAALSAVGALLATALIVTPAATTRLVVNRIRPWQAATVALAAVEGVGGLWIAYELNAPPGAGIAVLAGSAFVLTALARTVLLSGAVRRRRVAVAGRAGTLAVVAAALVPLAACGSSAGGGASGDGGSAGGRIDVVATSSVMGDLARQVGGGTAQVHELIGAGVDPHEYEPRPADVEALASADVILVSGLGLDDWARELIESSGSGAEVVDVGAGVPVKRPGDDGAGDDPHWWHDPSNAVAATRSVERALSAARPGEARAIRAAGAAYRERLQALDLRIARCIARVPAGERKLVTNHDALRYFTERYGLRVVGAVIPSQSTAGKTSAGELATLERTIENEGVLAVFPEEAVSSKLADQIARATGASARYALYGDALGAKGSGAETYERMLAANADSIVRGISGGRLHCGERP